MKRWPEKQGLVKYNPERFIAIAISTVGQGVEGAQILGGGL